MKRQTLLTLLLVIVTMMWANTTIAQSYGLKIAGTEIKLSTSSDLSGEWLKSGKVHWNAETNTLTLDNASIKTKAKEAGIYSNINNLTIQVKGESSISSDGFSAIKTNESHCTITGGTLKVSGEHFGLYAMSKASMTIKDCIVVSDGSVGTNNLDAKITIKNSTLTAKGKGAYKSMQGIQELTLKSCAISQPESAVYDAALKGVALDGKLVTDKVVIEPITTYELMIAGTKVTSANCKDLSVIDGVSGTVKYDHSTKTLTLDNASINAKNDKCGIDAYSALNIVVKGTVNVTSEKNNALFLTGKSSINGTGTLYATGMSVCGIEVRDLSIEGCTVHAKGKWGISGLLNTTAVKLTIRNATVTAEGEKGSICDFKTFTLDGCAITQPEGAAFSESLHGVALDGKIVTDKVAISPKDTGITSLEAEAESLPLHKKGIYTLQGVKMNMPLDKLPEGIYIVDGKKVIKK